MRLIHLTLLPFSVSYLRISALNLDITHQLLPVVSVASLDSLVTRYGILHSLLSSRFSRDISPDIHMDELIVSQIHLAVCLQRCGYLQDVMHLTTQSEPPVETVC